MVSLLAATLALAKVDGVLVVDGLAIAQAQAGKWRTVELEKHDPVGKLRNLKFREVGLGRLGSTLTKSALDWMEEVPGWYFSNESTANRVLWHGPAPKLPKLQPLSPSTTYLTVVRRALEAKGLKGIQPKIQRIYSVDLDADGMREVVIEAAPKREMVAQTMEKSTAADYSLVLIRFVEKGRAQTKMLEYADGRSGTLNCASQIRAIADFDGDGKSELVTSANYYEGTQATVWSFRSAKLRKLASSGSGL